MASQTTLVVGGVVVAGGALWWWSRQPASDAEPGGAETLSLAAELAGGAVHTAAVVGQQVTVAAVNAPQRASHGAATAARAAGSGLPVATEAVGQKQIEAGHGAADATRAAGDTGSVLIEETGTLFGADQVKAHEAGRRFKKKAGQVAHTFEDVGDRVGTTTKRTGRKLAPTARHAGKRVGKAFDAVGDFLTPPGAQHRASAKKGRRHKKRGRSRRHVAHH